MPCLGCLGLNLMDPFKGASFHASHVISFAHSKIVGSSVEDCWNLVPLCGPCNLNIGSTHLIAWFVQKYNNATEEPTMQMMIANALGEDLESRGLLDFADLVYHHGPRALLSKEAENPFLRQSYGRSCGGGDCPAVWKSFSKHLRPYHRSK